MQLLSQSLRVNLGIKVTPHCSLNSTQSLTFDADLLNKTDGEIREGLKDYGIIAVRHTTV